MTLESSNVAQRWTAVSTSEKCKIRSKEVMWGSRDPLLNFGTPNNFLTNEARIIKFGTYMDGNEY